MEVIEQGYLNFSLNKSNLTLIDFLVSYGSEDLVTTGVSIFCLIVVLSLGSFDPFLFLSVQLSFESSSLGIYHSSGISSADSFFTTLFLIIKVKF